MIKRKTEDKKKKRKEIKEEEKDRGDMIGRGTMYQSYL